MAPGAAATFYNQKRSTTDNANSDALRQNAAVNRNAANVVTTSSQGDSGANYYPASQSGPFSVFQDTTLTQAPFGSQTPVSPTFTLKTSAPPPSSGMSPPITQPPSGGPSSGQTQSQNPFAGPFFDPSDPALFNFDLSSMNFENRYGAMEFGMLGHMATGAGDSPSDSTQRGSIGRSGSGQFPSASAYGESSGNQQPFMFGDPLLNDWSAGSAGPGQVLNVGGGVYPQSGQAGLLSGGALPGADAPHAFAIESGPGHLTSPDSTASAPIATGYEDNAMHGMAKTNANANANANGPRPVISTPNLKHQSLQINSRRRHRNPSMIYQAVKEPYPYTSGFHNLTALIQRRFSPQKTLQIAKALASIRPSFIATTKTLNRDDLIFMEKCFQRTLWEYEDFINACGTPTIVCRRTGEVAAVGKEFSILTGWKKEVLLGKEPNLNVNRGGSSGSGSQPQSGTSSRGSFTPHSATLENMPNNNNNSITTNSRPQPVFLAELLDDDSVVEFYEDFARLAFGDSRGSVMTTCKLLKYKTREDMDSAAAAQQSVDDLRHQHSGGKWNNSQHQPNHPHHHHHLLRKGGIAGEAGMNRLGFKDGKVECAYCWTVKRDVFDIPMLIIMNVSFPPLPLSFRHGSDRFITVFASALY